MFDVRKLTGWKQDTVGIQQTAREVGSLRQVASNLIGGTQEKEVHLWQALLSVKPTWRRGAQGIGDCFVENTLVTMANGAFKRIQNVKIGEYVANPLGGPSRRVVDIIEKPYNGIVITLTAGGCTVSCTPDHEFHVPVNQYESSIVAAKDLRPGVKLKTASRIRSDGTAESKQPKIEGSIDSYHYRGKVYCLTVETDNCFYAGGFAVENCVSWGAELACTILMALDAIAGLGEWIAEAATEAIYGLARVEALGKTRGGRSDGAFGYAAAKALRDFGVALRINYANETGIAEHDLTKYDARKAKEWGDYGCGGSRDQGKLDAIIKQHPVGHIAQVKTIDEANGALDNYYPFTIASMAGFGDMKRNAEGLCAWVNSWAHQMMVAARRYVRGKAQYRVFQSWGDCCSGPDPGIDELLPKTASSGLYLPSSATTRADFIRRLILPDPAFPYAVESAADWNAISATSWWIDEATLAKILRTGDCWALAGIEGFRPRKLNVRKAVLDALKRG